MSYAVCSEPCHGRAMVVPQIKGLRGFFGVCAERWYAGMVLGYYAAPRKHVQAGGPS